MGLTVFLTTLVFPLITAPQFNLPVFWERISWHPPAAVSFVGQVQAKGANGVNGINGIKGIKGIKEKADACLLSYCIFQSKPGPSVKLLEKVPETGFFVLVNVGENKEFVFEDGKLIGEYLVSTGSLTRFESSYHTPVGEWKIVEKTKTNPNSEFGPYFLRLAKRNGKDFVPTSLALHGTNEPELLGKPGSHGCIRHSNETILHLAQILPIGTIVETVNKN